jgi:type II secretory pathway pseudopilin PulG
VPYSTIESPEPYEAAERIEAVVTLMILQLRSDNRGFSLMGMILLTIIISGLSGTAYILLEPSFTSNRFKRSEEKMNQINSAINVYKTHHSGTAPAVHDHLVTPVAPPCSVNTDPASSFYRSLQGWCGPYIDQVIAENANDFKTDEWGTAFQYDGVTLRSCGPNKTCGDTDDLTVSL